MKSTIKLDGYDRKILRILQNDGKISNASLAKQIGLTPPSTLERVKKLQKNGFIEGYRAVLNRKKMGRGITCFIAFNLKYHGEEDTHLRVKNALLKIEGVEEVHLVTGRHDYIVKINVKDVDDLQDFIVNKLTHVEFLDKLETFISISSRVNPNPIPIPDDE